MSATQRTIKSLEELGYTVGIVERFISKGGPFGVRKDLFGLFDLIAMHPDNGIIGVQCFTTAWTDHLMILEERRVEALTWIAAGGHIEFWGWRKLKLKRGGVAMRWTPRIEVYDATYFE
jgi:hypothetical protein